ncbi:MAG: hypothetical protein A2017_06790 [Lentisphaerae bacterium GWF2_44_16]|nr:MAG: hypothetical protein A2017_06790 [Lentisphaerae bacterium GWF2_44_16]
MNRLFSKTVQPDFCGLRECIQRKSNPKRVFFIEFAQDSSVKNALTERFNLMKDLNVNHPFFFYQKEITLQKFLGYDTISCCLLPKFPSQINDKKNEASISEDKVASGPIQNWEDFENYPWPKIADMNLSALDWLEKELPENMKCRINVPIGFYKMLLGYEDMLYMMYDNPSLMKAVFEKLTAVMLDYTRTISQYSCVGIIWGCDDMGFKTQTFFPPGFIRANILPMHKSLAEMAHQHGKLYFLHACGNLEEIMNDLITMVKIDAKHSFEDVIVPVTEMKKRYGDRVALLGGVDVDFLCRADELALRKRIREILEICLPGGGYCLGSGNSIADYVPLDNYLIMLDEGRNFNC